MCPAGLLLYLLLCTKVSLPDLLINATSAIIWHQQQDGLWDFEAPLIISNPFKCCKEFLFSLVKLGGHPLKYSSLLVACIRTNNAD